MELKEGPYQGIFEEWADVAREFATETNEPSVVVYAEYGYEDYSGSATVIYGDKAGKFYLVQGGHCSCYGLEGQFEPTDYDNAAELIEALTKGAGGLYEEGRRDAVVERLRAYV